MEFKNSMGNLEPELEFWMNMMKFPEKRVNTETPLLPTLDISPLLRTPESRSRPENKGNFQNQLEKWGKFHHSVFPKVELSSFERDRPREWLRKCEKFFAIFQIGESQKLEVIELYLEGKVDVWYQGLKLM